MKTEARGEALELEQFVLLNQAIAALVKAGIPLESGLAIAGQSSATRDEAFKQRLALRLAAGHSFSEALRLEGAQLPRLYRAIVEAGARSDNMPEALQSLANFARESLELRRRVDLALLYPALVVLLAAGLFAGLIVYWNPTFTQAYVSLRLPLSDWSRASNWLRERYWFWVWIVPALVAGLSGWWWFSTRGRYGIKGTTDTGVWSAFQMFPGMRSILANFRRANFCDLLAMLLAHHVPLPEAVVLAGEAAGDSALNRLASRISEGVCSGLSFSDCLAIQRDLPPFVTWMLINGDRQGHLVNSLRHVARMSRHRASLQSDWLRGVLPTCLMVVIGGTTVLAYALAVFMPLAEMLSSLSLVDL